ncbi:hypothetical protein [Variovorax boronicumulans]|uniref:hypothetical protein n=1 Tax=Variovorax boronicumulans TaxID=436515 RepID=UPI001C57EFF0
MKVKAKTSFVHGIYSMHRGEEREIPDGIASDLHKAGFVEEAGAKKAPAASNKKAADPENKSKK